jgi:hypothetical protein
MVARADAHPGPGPRVREQVLATAPTDGTGWHPYGGRVAFSADGRRHGFIAERDGRWVAVVDGAVGPEAEEVRDLQFAGRVAIYRMKRAGRWYAVKDGVIGEPYRDVERLFPSADGAHLTYVAETRDGAVVVHDGVAGPPFERVHRLAAAGARWAYVGERSHSQHAIVDGVVSEPFYYVRDLALSADGARCAYLANSDGGQQHVVSDGRRWTFAADAYGGDVTWTGDGNLLAWWERRGDRLVMVVEGEPIELPARLSIEAVAASPRVIGGVRTVAVLAEDTGRRQLALVVDADGVRRGPGFGTVDSLTFSRDGARVAYRGWDRDGARWIVDGAAGPPHADVLAAGFSPDGARVAYQAQASDRSWRMIVDGVAGDPTELDDGGLGPPAWSPDGRHLAYWLLDGDAAVVLDGRRASPIAHPVELRWIARDKRGAIGPGAQRLAFGTVDRAGRIVWRELAP